MELIAHRAGNQVDTVVAAARVADAVELDVHLFRGRIEVRHAKVIWPFAIHWEQWEILPYATPPRLHEVLTATPTDVHLWLDLKGFTGRMSRRVLREVGDRRPLTTSTRSWWILRPIRRAGGVRTFRSVGSAWQRWLITRVRFHGPDDGVVMHERFATPELVAHLRRRTDQVVVWAVTDLSRAVELAAMGVTGVIADELDLLATIGERVKSV